VREDALTPAKQMRLATMRRLSGQNGLSFWGFLFVCAFIGFVALAVIRLFPLYMESFKVSTALEAMATMTGVATKK
jgi:hypothetical protein